MDKSRKLLVIVLVVIGVLILASDSTGKRVDDAFSPSGDITNIQIENGNVDLKIIEGDTFYVKGENLEENSYTFTQEGDTLIIKTDKNGLDFIHIGLFENPATLTLTIPRDLQFDTVTIKNDSGDFNATTGLHAKQFSIIAGSGDVVLEGIKTEVFDSSVGSGDFEVKDLTANDIDASVGSGDAIFGYVECEKMSMEVGSGELTFKSLEAKDCEFVLGSGDIEGKNLQVVNMTAQTGSGDIELKGELTGVSKFTCGSGDIELNLDGDLEEYSLEIEGSDIEVNGEEYDKKYKSDETMDKQLHLKAGSGDIEVTIR
ncbi:DUF4097 family beta strand repeat-containing protein [Anaerosporobacter sp.]